MVDSKIKTLALAADGGGWPWEPARPCADGTPEAGQLPAPGDLIDGKYRVERVLARGGSGVVYAAAHSVSGKRVALKWMTPSTGSSPYARERFLREASATARIAHPNIVDIYDVCADPGAAVYLVMEYLHGETLAERLARGPVSATQAIAWLMPALRAVAAAHAHGVIHRDLKPENIFLCCNDAGEPWNTKLLDFGISKLTRDAEPDLALTWSDTILGTPYYMSPEQIRGARSVDERADVYALGVILFELLTGRKPFEADTYNELIVKIVTQAPPKLIQLVPALDPALVAIVERAMAHDACARIASVAALASALEPFAGGVSLRKSRGTAAAPSSGTTTPSLAPQAAGQRAAPRLRTWLPIASACALLVGFELITQHPTSDPTPPARSTSTVAQTPAPAPTAGPSSTAPVQLTSEIAAPMPEAPRGEPASPMSTSTSDNKAAAADNSERPVDTRARRQRAAKRAAVAHSRQRMAAAPAPPGLSLDSRDFR